MIGRRLIPTCNNSPYLVLQLQLVTLVRSRSSVDLETLKSIFSSSVIGMRLVPTVDNSPVFVIQVVKLGKSRSSADLDGLKSIFSAPTIGMRLMVRVIVQYRSVSSLVTSRAPQ